MTALKSEQFNYVHTNVMYIYMRNNFEGSNSIVGFDSLCLCVHQREQEVPESLKLGGLSFIFIFICQQFKYIFEISGYI